MNYHDQLTGLSISFGWMTKYDIDQDIQEVLKKAEDLMYKKKLFEGPSMREKSDIHKEYLTIQQHLQKK